MILPRGVLVLAIVAILSVALNLFLAGNQLGHQFRGPQSPMNFEQRLHNWWREMPPADQAIAEGVLQQHRGEIMEKWRAFRPANQRLVELRATLQSTLIEIAQKVSPEGRKHMRVPGGL